MVCTGLYNETLSKSNFSNKVYEILDQSDWGKCHFQGSGSEGSEYFLFKKNLVDYRK